MAQRSAMLTCISGASRHTRIGRFKRWASPASCTTHLHIYSTSTIYCVGTIGVYSPLPGCTHPVAHRLSGGDKDVSCWHDPVRKWAICMMSDAGYQ